MQANLAASSILHSYICKLTLVLPTTHIDLSGLTSVVTDTLLSNAQMFGPELLNKWKQLILLNSFLRDLGYFFIFLLVTRATLSL